MNFLFFLYQSTALSCSRAVDDHQMYSGGSVVGKASTISIDVSPTPPLVFTKGSKSSKFGVVFNTTQLWAARVENAARYPNSETKFFYSHDHFVYSPSLVKLGPRIPGNRSVKVPRPPLPQKRKIPRLNRQ